EASAPRSARTRNGVGVGNVLRHGPHSTNTRAIPRVSAPATIHGTQAMRVLARAADTAPPAAPGHGSSIASIPILRSPISLSRFFGSFARQRDNNRRMGAGVAAGRADQSGSRSRILAIVSETVSPGNARRPVNIS